jgi:hypothetical protein
MTRARNDLLLLVPLKFYLTNQPKNALRTSMAGAAAS